jgi:hypothetical protein
LEKIKIEKDDIEINKKYRPSHVSAGLIQENDLYIWKATIGSYRNRIPI